MKTIKAMKQANRKVRGFTLIELMIKFVVKSLRTAWYYLHLLEN